MEIRNFITFKKIVEMGSFTKASQALGYAQSTITSHIQQIEDYYGAPIFERLGHKILLTDLGSQLLDQVEQLLNINHNIEKLKEVSATQHPVIKIGAEETILLYKMNNLFRDFKLLCPDVEIILINEPYMELQHRVLDGSADVIFIIDKKVKNKEFEVLVIDQEPMMFVKSPDYEKNRADNVFRIPRIIMTRKGGTYNAIFGNYLSKGKIIHEIVMEAWSIELVKQNLIFGMGVSFLPQISVSKEIEEGLLIGDIVDLPEKDQIYSQMIYHNNKKMNRPLEMLIDLISNY